VRRSTIITLGASVAFGILAVVLARGWINSTVKTEYDRQSSAQETTLEVVNNLDLVSVVVVDTDVNFGDVLLPDMLKVVEYPFDAVPEGTYQAKNNIFVDDTIPTVVLRRMARNEPLLDYKITGPGARGSLSALITEGKRAVSVRVNEVAGVAGFVMPGDFVDVLYTRDEESRRNGNDLQTDILLQNVKVLGIDQDLNDMSAIPNVVKTVTLEVSNVDAQKLHLAQDAGKLSLTLRRAGDVTIDDNLTVHQKSILKTPQKYQPVARVTARVAVKKESDNRHANVTVIRGEDRAQVKVLKDPDPVAETETLAGGEL